MAVNEASGRLETAQLKAPSAESMIQEAEEKILERQQQFKSSPEELNSSSRIIKTDLLQSGLTR